MMANQTSASELTSLKFSNSSNMSEFVDFTVCDPHMNHSTNHTTGPGIGTEAMVTIFLMFISGTLGNLIALFVLFRTKSSTAKKTVFYTFVIALLWTDLIGIIIASSVTIAAYVHFPELWLCHQWGICKFHAVTMVFFGLAENIMVALMAVERLIALKFTFNYNKYFSITKAKMYVLLCYVVSAVVTILPFLGFGRYQIQFPYTWCYLNFHAETPIDIGYAYLYAGLNLISLVTIIVSNIIVIMVLLRMRFKRMSLSSPLESQRMQTNKAKETELQMVWLLSGIMCVFTVCWAPLMVQIIINNATGVRDKRVDLIVIRLACINQILDPWVYILLRKRFFNKISNYLCAFFCKKGTTGVRSLESLRALHAVRASKMSNRKQSQSLWRHSHSCSDREMMVPRHSDEEHRHGDVIDDVRDTNCCRDPEAEPLQLETDCNNPRAVRESDVEETCPMKIEVIDENDFISADANDINEFQIQFHDENDDVFLDTTRGNVSPDSGCFNFGRLRFPSRSSNNGCKGGSSRRMSLPVTITTEVETSELADTSTLRPNNIFRSLSHKGP